MSHDLPEWVLDDRCVELAPEYAVHSRVSSLVEALEQHLSLQPEPTVQGHLHTLLLHITDTGGRRGERRGRRERRGRGGGKRGEEGIGGGKEEEEGDMG